MATMESISIMAIVRRVAGATLLCLLGASAQVAALACSSGIQELRQPEISTVSGTGAAGVQDGRPDRAEFIEPDAVTSAPDGTLYIADGGAQNIRAIKNGVATTVAGEAPSGPSVQQKIGGYADGPARSARFHRPVGIAVGADGSLFIADSLNHVVRKISRGVVSTFAGSATALGAADGKDAAALFVQPRGIASDAAGNLYVADAGAGIRKIAPDQTVTTLNYGNDGGVCGIAARGSGANLTLAFTDSKALYLVQGARIRRVAFDQDVEPPFEHRHIGFACGVTILDQDSVAITDPSTNSVRFVRFPIGGVVGSYAMLRTLAAGQREGSLSLGGYRDGRSDEALVDLPRGLALTANGTLVVADAGNRRIRSIQNVNPRGPVTVDGADQLQNPTFPADAYRIVFMSNSYGFINAMWPDSIPAQIEAGLLRDRSEIGLTKCAVIAPYRMSGGAVQDLADFTTTYYGDGAADLIVFLIDNANVGHEIPKLAAAKKLPAGLTRHADVRLWRQAIVDELRAFANTMSKSGTKVLFVVLPDARSISPLEQVNNERWPASLQDYYSLVRPDFMPYPMAEELIGVVGSSGVPTLDLFHPMDAAEALPNRKPFFNPVDYHPSPDGNIWMGTAILRDIESRQPWKASTPYISGPVTVSQISGIASITWHATVRLRKLLQIMSREAALRQLESDALEIVRTKKSEILPGTRTIVADVVYARTVGLSDAYASDVSNSLERLLKITVSPDALRQSGTWDAAIAHHALPQGVSADVTGKLPPQ
jgi:hypothetical protein